MNNYFIVIDKLLLYSNDCITVNVFSWCCLRIMEFVTQLMMFNFFPKFKTNQYLLPHSMGPLKLLTKEGGKESERERNNQLYMTVCCTPWSQFFFLFWLYNFGKVWFYHDEMLWMNFSAKRKTFATMEMNINLIESTLQANFIFWSKFLATNT